MILLLLAAMSAGSCIFNALPVMSADKPHSIIFTVSLEGHHTKASWSDNYESGAGVPFDSRILPNDMNVLVMTKDGTCLGAIRNLYFWHTDTAHSEYQFTGQMPDAFVEHFNTFGASDPRYRFMVIANSSGNISLDQDMTYSHTQLDPSGENASIPMWGIKEVDVTPLLDQESQDIGKISLLRSAARIDIKLSENLKQKGTKLKSATLKYYNKTGHILPSGANSVSDTYKLNQEECINAYRHTALNLPFIEDKASGKLCLYVTEYDNINFPEERNKISLELEIAGETQNYQDIISFCNYIDGQPQEGSEHNIVRNHIYEYEILSILGSNIELKYMVADWETEDWDSDLDYEDHELMYPTYHNPVVPVEFLQQSTEPLSKYVITKKPEMYHHNGQDLETGAFECFFQILAPASVQWKPTISGSKENYRTRIYSYPYDELIFDSGDPLRQGFLSYCEDYEWFRILVFPLSSEGAGTVEIDFGISYYQDWTDQYINLYINGDHDTTRWPDSGNDPKIIKIRHILEK